MRLMNIAAVSGAILGAVIMTTPLITQASARMVHINITDHGFTPNNVTALVSQQIHITVVNKGHKTHQFSIPYYRLYTQNLKPGASSEIEFSPSVAGRFEMMSDPSGRNKPEFIGHFIVTDQK